MCPVRYTCTMLASMRATASSSTQDRYKIDETQEWNRFVKNYLVTLVTLNCKLLVNVHWYIFTVLCMLTVLCIYAHKIRYWQFSPKWGNFPVTQELRDEEKRWADVWKRRRLDSDRIEADKQRKRGGSPVRGSRSSKSTFLDEIDDPPGWAQQSRSSGLWTRKGP